MTDREKLLKLLDRYEMDSMLAILDCYFDVYYKDYTAGQISSIINSLNMYLHLKIDELDSARFVANERARYIKDYLEGKTWLTEEAAKANIQPQIDNAQAIIDAYR